MKKAGKNIKPQITEMIAKGEFKNEFAPLADLTNIIKYTDADLLEFKKLIYAKINESEKDYALIKGILSRRNNDIKSTFCTFKLSEDDIYVFSKEEMASLALSHRNFIERLEHSLTRIQNKTYSLSKIPRNAGAEKIRETPYVIVRIDITPETIRLN